MVHQIVEQPSNVLNHYSTFGLMSMRKVCSDRSALSGKARLADSVKSVRDLLRAELRRSKNNLNSATKTRSESIGEPS